MVSPPKASLKYFTQHEIFIQSLLPLVVNPNYEQSVLTTSNQLGMHVSLLWIVILVPTALLKAIFLDDLTPFVCRGKEFALSLSATTKQEVPPDSWLHRQAAEAGVWMLHAAAMACFYPCVCFIARWNNCLWNCTVTLSNIHAWMQRFASEGSYPLKNYCEINWVES